MMRVRRLGPHAQQAFVMVNEIGAIASSLGPLPPCQCRTQAAFGLRSPMLALIVAIQQLPDGGDEEAVTVLNRTKVRVLDEDGIITPSLDSSNAFSLDYDRRVEVQNQSIT